jgi:lysozyme
MVVDVEESMGQSNPVVIANLTSLLAALQQWTGRQPMIYTDSGFWNGLGTGAFGTYPLWIAQYEVTAPTLPAGWALWDFWQHSETGSIAGIQGSVDLNVYSGSLAALQKAFPSA